MYSRTGGKRLPNGLRSDQFAYGHPRQPRAVRAKIFIPFDALRGYREALRETERQVEAVQRTELSDDALAEIDRQFHRLDQGVRVRIEYFREGAIMQATGPILRRDDVARTLAVGDTYIAFGGIRNIEVL